MTLVSTRITRALLFGAAVTGAAALAAQCPDQLLNNGTFDSDINGFSPYGGTVEFTSNGASGGGLRIACSGGCGAGDYDSPAVVGTNYTLSFDASFITASTIANQEYANGRLEFRDASGGTLQGVDVPLGDVGNGFQSYSVDLVAPANAQNIVAQFNLGSGAEAIIDNVCLQATTPTTTFCAGNVISNGSVDDNVNGFNNPYGDIVVTHAPTSGVGGSGALDADVTTGAFGGFGQYQVSVQPSPAFVYTFSAKVLSAGSNRNGLVRTQNDGAVITAVQVSLEATDFLTYRLVVPADDPAVNAITVQGNLGGGARVLFDQMCVLPFTPEAAPVVTNNLIANGDFENGNPLPSITLSYDPATGLRSGIINSAGYQEAKSATFPAVPGQEYTGGGAGKYIGTLPAGGYANLNVEFLDASGNLIDPASYDGYRGIPAGMSFSAISNTVTAPANAASVRLRAQTGGSATGYLVVDDLFLTVGQASLPVELAAFDAAPAGEVNVVSWTTASEINTAAFLVERSADGVADWEAIAEVAPRGGEGVGADYVFTDVHPIATAYYRLRSVDYDGAYEVSHVLHVTRATNGGTKVYPNPVFDELMIERDFAVGEEYRVLDVTGRTVLSGVLPVGPHRFVVHTAALPAGQYFLRVGAETFKVVK